MTFSVDGRDPIIIHSKISPNQNDKRVIYEVDYIEGFSGVNYCNWDLNKMELEIV